MSDHAPLPGVGRAEEFDLTVGLAQEKRPVITFVDDYFWRCWVCGWLGQGLSSVDQAMREGKRHFEEMHFDQTTVNVERRDSR